MTIIPSSRERETIIHTFPSSGIGMKEVVIYITISWPINFSPLSLISLFLRNQIIQLLLCIGVVVDRVLINWFTKVFHFSTTKINLGFENNFDLMTLRGHVGRTTFEFSDQVTIFTIYPTLSNNGDKSWLQELWILEMKLFLKRFLASCIKKKVDGWMVRFIINRVSKFEARKHVNNKTWIKANEVCNFFNVEGVH